MDIAEKRKLLNLILERKATPDCLIPPQVYIFDQISNDPPTYKHNDKIYSEEQYKAFCQWVKKRNDGSMMWHEEKSYDHIITFVPAEGCESLIGEMFKTENNANNEQNDNRTR